MSDHLKIDHTTWTGMGHDNVAVIFGYGAAHDSRGNSWSGLTLSCTSKEPVRLNLWDWSVLADGIADARSYANFHLNFGNELRVRSNHESPLQKMCESLNPPPRHVPARGGQRGI